MPFCYLFNSSEKSCKKSAQEFKLICIIFA